MSKYTFEHIHLVAVDPDAEMDFYARNFGAEIFGTRILPDGRKLTEASLGGVGFKIVGPGLVNVRYGNPKLGLDHFGLRTDDLVKTAQELKIKGIEFISDPRPASKPGTRVCFVAGPSGVPIEILEIT